MKKYPPPTRPHENPPRQKRANQPAVRQVRIIAGEYRRRLIGFVEADGLRPTPDRVRETVFNWLGERLIHARVLDCCAGSGVLGFEALSRGANHVFMIEPNPKQVKQLQASVDLLKIPPASISILATTAQNAIATLPNEQAFDVVFLDPPYALDLWQPLLQQLIDASLVDSHSLIYIEADRLHEQVLGDYKEHLAMIKSKKMGQVYCGLYQPITPQYG